ncbi:thiosulfate sulfurtransferase GlpE [Shewanella sp. A3A]|uniref:Thiosulfate sulfurtransferase GlpE n=1 Tax=Shewanella electrica TaxID=515560 RepID=A0ABT2FPU7_9GAMM|nr:thiosulfate sulfurtransferase GlpE [Shewanella electrica]MCH1920332.1 thiosulfate sulfurtransferase GlpE [Shewanella ferrihydritica]MCH1925894.1 thiosulfate sulfurtransferase GlpE [Shewanella electrica]MCS4557221.1 thiosulfate sulfurtransferase GlpE [Shewanella electrica]
MSTYKILNISELQQRLQQGDELQIIDIRDPASFEQGHIAGSMRVGNDNIAQFMTEADLDAPLVVVCYHGISSQGAAEYLHQQGFDDIYSLEGGYTAWAAANG